MSAFVIDRAGDHVAAHGIDFLASFAADLDLQSTPRSEEVDGGSSVLISGDIQTSDAAMSVQDGSKPCPYPPVCGSKRGT
ncbi:hypothetical protein VPH35_026968 [Triticum aestivum]